MTSTTVAGGEEGASENPAETKLVFGDLEIDLLAYEVVHGGDVVDMTRREFQLLVCLAGAPRHTFSASELLTLVWNVQGSGEALDTVREHIYRLRKTLEPDPTRPEYIVTVRGFGYRFDP